MSTNEPKGDKPRTQINDLPGQETELSREEQENVKGGILPYVEQDNLRTDTTKITDGTSNTVKIPDGTSNIVK